MVYELDSVVQSSRWEAAESDAEFEQEVLGHIRASLLLSGHLLITHAMVLDGAFFIRFPPRRIAAALGMAEMPLPITVVSPYASLQDALMTMLSDPQFAWQLQATEPGSEWPYDHVRSAWDQWLEAERTGYIQFVKPALAVPRAEGFVSDEPAASFTNALTHIGQDFLNFARQQGGRTRVWREFLRLRHVNQDSEHIESVELAWEWWNFHYLREIARQNAATWITFTKGTRYSGTEDAEPGTQLHIPEVLLDDASSYPPPRFGLAYHRSQDSRETFLVDPTPARLRTLSYSATAEATPATPTHVRRLAMIRLLGFAFAVLFALLPLGLWSALIAGLGLNSPHTVLEVLGLVGVGLLSVYLSSWPFDERREWKQLKQLNKNASLEVWARA